MIVTRTTLSLSTVHTVIVRRSNRERFSKHIYDAGDTLAQGSVDVEIRGELFERSWGAAIAYMMRRPVSREKFPGACYVTLKTRTRGRGAWNSPNTARTLEF